MAGSRGCFSVAPIFFLTRFLFCASSSPSCLLHPLILAVPPLLFRALRCLALSACPVYHSASHHLTRGVSPPVLGSPVAHSVSMQAISYYEAAVRASPGQHHLRQELAQLYIFLKNYSQAEAVLNLNLDGAGRRPPLPSPSPSLRSHDGLCSRPPAVGGRLLSRAHSPPPARLSSVVLPPLASVRASPDRCP